MGTYTILLVDDEELALAGMENGVNWASLGIDHIYKADSMGSAVRVIERHPVDIMVSDIEMPGGSGLELIRWVREHYPEIVSISIPVMRNFLTVRMRSAWGRRIMY